MAASEESSSEEYPLQESGYELLDQIGGNGQRSLVYKAICLPKKSFVAIKVVDPKLVPTEAFDIQWQIVTMVKLKLYHPALLKPYCVFSTENKMLWVVTPFMSGGSLDSVMASSYPDGLPEPFIAAVLNQILPAVSYLHENDRIHGDIKSGNILIDSNGSVKLTGYDISKSFYLPGHMPPFSKPTIDEEKVYWIAPELHGIKADIWALGITALELAHGGPPFCDISLSKLTIEKICERFPFSDPFENFKKPDYFWRKGFSDTFKEMVCLCLVKDYKERASAEELLGHLFFKNCNNVLDGVPAVELRDRSKRKNSADVNEEKRIEIWDPAFDIGEEKWFKEWNADVTTVEEQWIKEWNVDVNSVENTWIKEWNFNKELLILNPVSSGGGGLMNRMNIVGVFSDYQRQIMKRFMAFVEGKAPVELTREAQLVNEILNLQIDVDNQKKNLSVLKDELFHNSL